MSVLSDDPARKEAYLDSLERLPGSVLPFPTPYRHHLYDLVRQAIREVGTGFHHAVEFKLFNRWEAEYIKEQMRERCPHIEFRMIWTFGGPMKDDSDAEKVRAGYEGTDLQN